MGLFEAVVFVGLWYFGVVRTKYDWIILLVLLSLHSYSQPTWHRQCVDVCSGWFDNSKSGKKKKGKKKKEPTQFTVKWK